jgi:hypothetical protein
MPAESDPYSICSDDGITIIYSHGLGKNLTHTSPKCQHKAQATAGNMMNSNNISMHAIANALAPTPAVDMVGSPTTVTI